MPTRYTALLAAITALMTVATLGCATRTVYVVRDNEPAPRYDQPAPRVDNRTDYRYDDAFTNAPPVESRYSSANQFVDQLAPYGNWQQHSRYGLIFIPHRSVTGRNFRPYTRGSWNYTQYGWTWNSSMPFGWATGHYGRWFYDGRAGWAWVPDTQWGPAWVTWRRGGGYTGWAPLPPGASYGGNYSVYRTSWVFVSTSSLGSSNIYSYAVTGPRYNDCYSRTSPYRETVDVRGRRYYRGPDPSDVRRGGGRVVHRPIRESDRGPTVGARDGRRTTENRGDRDNDNRARERDRAPENRGDRGADNRRPDPRKPDLRDPRGPSVRDTDLGDRGSRVISEPRRDPRNDLDLGERDARVRADPRNDLDLGDRNVGVRTDTRNPYDLGDRSVGVRADPKDTYDLGERDARVRADGKGRDNSIKRIDGKVTERAYDGDELSVRGGHDDVRRPRYENVRPPEDNPYAQPPRNPTVAKDPRRSPNVRTPRNAPRVDSRSGVTRPQPTNTTTRGGDTRSTTRSKSKSTTRTKSRKTEKKATSSKRD